MADMSQIVSRLNTLTGENRVPWKSTSDVSAFVAVYGDMSVRITSRGQEPANIILLGVYDRHGNLLDSATHDASMLPSASTYFTSQMDYRELKSLYQSARRIALGADQNLANLLERMNAAPPVPSE